MEQFKFLGAGSRPNSGRLATGSGSNESSRPVSPTDELLSPVSKQMRGLKKIGSAADMKRREKRRIHINLHKEIPPLPFPPNSIDFILGTSSASRREVIDVLRWKYTQMSPDIDGKRYSPSSVVTYGLILIWIQRKLSEHLIQWSFRFLSLKQRRPL